MSLLLSNTIVLRLDPKLDMLITVLGLRNGDDMLRS